MFLTDAELFELTGRKRPSGQIAWLRLRHWRFEVNAAGHPRVARAYLERRMVARDGTAAVESASPDFGAIRA